MGKETEFRSLITKMDSWRQEEFIKIEKSMEKKFLIMRMVN